MSRMDSGCAVTNAYYTIAYMPFFRPAISLVCVFFLVIPPVGAQTTTNFLSRVTNPYRRHEIGAVNLSNSNRLDSLVRAGILYLSLQDTIALALENNLDIELQRYGAQIADASLLRAKAGGLLRGTTSAVTSSKNMSMRISPAPGSLPKK